MHAFWLSLALVFLAELGDKTQLVALTLAARFNARVVLTGIFSATLVVHILSVALGGLAGELLPTAWIQFLAGLAFIGFGLWTLRGDSLAEEEGIGRRAASPFLLVFVTFFLAELGDKTMLSTVTLAAARPLVPVWIGSSLGMVLSDGLAIWVGKVLGTRLPERWIKLGAALIFIGFGLFGTIQGGIDLHLAAWALGAAILALMARVFLYRPARRKGTP